jgi:hypothetical protein
MNESVKFGVWAAHNNLDFPYGQDYVGRRNRENSSLVPETFFRHFRVSNNSRPWKRPNPFPRF